MPTDVLNHLDGLLITNPTNIRYLIGFVGVETREREAYVLVTKSQAYLFTNALYREEARTFSFKRLNLLGSLALQGLTFVEISREKPFAKELNRVLLKTVFKKRQSLSNVRLGFEEADLTVAEYNKLKKELKGITLVPTTNRIEELRMIKRLDEIMNIRQAAKLTDQCFDFILGKLESEVTESEIAWEIEAFFKKRGAGIAFSPIVAFGKNSSQPHYQPPNRYSSSDPPAGGESRRHVPEVVNRIPVGMKLTNSNNTALRSSDIALLDFGARINGYCADMTRVVFIGKPTDEWEKAYKTVLEAQRAALEYLHLEGVKAHLPGGVRRSGATADRIARSVIKNAGLSPYPHSLGHAAGMDIHEAPRLTVKKDAKLTPNMVVTVEPGVYIEGQYGIRIEDLVLLKKDGVEVLSKSQKKLTIL